LSRRYVDITGARRCPCVVVERTKPCRQGYDGDEDGSEAGVP
jgi:hypothetical protein